MNRCGPEQKDTKEQGQMFKRVLKLQRGEVPDRKVKSHREGVQESEGIF